MDRDLASNPTARSRKTTQEGGAITPKLVEKILASNPPPLTARLCRELQRAWNEPAVREAEAADEGRRHEALYTQERQTREKVLVVIDPLGFTEVFAEAQVDCRVISLTPLDEGEQWLRRLPQCYRDLHYPGKVKANGMPWFKPELDGDAILKVLRWEAKLQQNATLEEIAAKLKGMA